MPDPVDGAEDATATVLSRGYVVLLLLAAVVGVIVSLGAWCFLELIYQIQREVFHHLPSALGYSHGAPLWWPVPVLAIAGVIVAFAIVRLPGNGGHVPADGLKVGGGPTLPREMPGIALAGLASIGLGTVIGPEAPLIALGSGLALATVRLARRPMPDQALTVVAAAGSFAAISLIFSSPIIAAIILIEATGIGGKQLTVVLLPGLIAAGVGGLVSVGMGSFTGLSTSAYALGALPLGHFARPDIGQFGWTIAIALLIAAALHAIVTGGRATHRLAQPRTFAVLPLAGIVVAGLAIAFSEASGKAVEEVLFSGQDQLSGLVSHAGTWTLSALVLLLAFKGVAYAISLGAFRGGPTFPAIFLGAAAGIAASHLPDFPLPAAVAVGIGAAVVSILRLPLSAIVVASLLTAESGDGAQALVIVGVVVAYLATLALSRWGTPRQAAGAGTPATSPDAAQAAAPAGAPAVAATGRRLR